jgi:limonene 1,2-monooxygenase
MVANRMVQLDHMSHGRVMMGVGPGALPGDAYMMGIDSTTQRIRMDEALGVVLRLFTDPEPITYKSDWFELKEAMLQLRPFQRPHMPIAVASVQSPSGVALAGKYGAPVLTITVPRDPSSSQEADLKFLWDVAEESAAEHGKTMDRHEWRLVLPVHLAESRKEAMNDARVGAGRYHREYFEHTMGRPPLDCPLEEIIDNMVDTGAWIVGTPDDCIEGIKRLGEKSGGFGGFMVQTIDWAPREKMLHSYELMARYVMPAFQGTTASTAASNQWAYERRDVLMAGRNRALDTARQTWAGRNN